jgi:hypothetical protein
MIMAILHRRWSLCLSLERDAQQTLDDWGRRQMPAQSDVRPGQPAGAGGCKKCRYSEVDGAVALKRVGRELRMLVENTDDQTSADPSLLRIIAHAHHIQALA